ncbi:MAG TPA: ferredoxin [Pseudonocardia sp.]|jgi:ferredoxin
MTSADVAAVVDHDRCAGISMCIQLAPGAFALDGAGQAVFQPGGDWTPDDLAEAEDACPMAAITVHRAGRRESENTDVERPESHFPDDGGLS